MNMLSFLSTFWLVHTVGIPIFYVVNNCFLLGKLDASNIRLSPIMVSEFGKCGSLLIG